MFIPCMIGTWQLLIIVLVVVLLFGGAKIPELMRGMGRGVKEFKDAMNTDYSTGDKQGMGTSERNGHDVKSDPKNGVKADEEKPSGKE